jgi:hypothetical protein
MSMASSRLMPSLRFAAALEEAVERVRDIQVGSSSSDLMRVVCRSAMPRRPWPSPPSTAVAHLLDDLGVDGVAPLPDLREGDAPERGPRSGVSRVEAAEPDDLQLVALGLVELDLVDHRVEALVVRA